MVSHLVIPKKTGSDVLSRVFHNFISCETLKLNNDVVSNVANIKKKHDANNFTFFAM